MKIKKITSQHRRDFQAIYVCEHCGDEHTGSGMMMQIFMTMLYQVWSVRNVVRNHQIIMYQMQPSIPLDTQFKEREYYGTTNNTD